MTRRAAARMRKGAADLAFEEAACLGEELKRLKMFDLEFLPTT